MGATTWRYYTPYQPFAEVAFRELCADVFARGDYVQPAQSIDDLLLPTERRVGRKAASSDDMRQIERERVVFRAIETGDMRGLSPAIRNFAKQMRDLRQATAFRGTREGGSRATRPRSIAEVLELAGESGTHSILDIERIAARPGFGVATALSADALRRAFGTDVPTHDDVEQHWFEVAEQLDRWHARYLVVYRDSKPDEYAFVGCSGD
jgi:hypothetical protein